RMISWYMFPSCISGSTSYRSEELLGRANSVGQRIDVVVAGVHVERRAGRRRDAVPPDDRPGAVVPDTDGDAQVVEHLAHVVRVDAVDGEGDRSPAGDGVGRADHRHARDLRGLLQRVPRE